MPSRPVHAMNLGLAILIAGGTLLTASGVTAQTAPGQQVLQQERVQFYVDPDSHASRQAREWRESRPEDAAAMDLLAAQPMATWFGEWNDDITADIDDVVTRAADAGAIPVLVSYYIPYRDCGHYSAGSMNDPVAYQAWIGRFAAGIGDRQAVVILEPDALSLTDCLSEAQEEERYGLISFAVETLEANGGTDVYIDAGHSNWLPSQETAERLKLAGIDQATGFALNTSNFQLTTDEVAFGHAVSDWLGLDGGTHFVIDTSRNGRGPWKTDDPETWCNPPGRATGTLPTIETGDDLVDAFLWLKPIGESDGECRGSFPAGEWDAEYALGMVQRSDLMLNSSSPEATPAP
jgi:endoglucanase